MDDLGIRLGVHELIGDYAERIDEDRLEEWPDLFGDPCRYLVISRANHRSEERRVGKECRALCRSRWSPYH